MKNLWLLSAWLLMLIPEAFAFYGTWTPKADMPTTRSTHVAFSLNGKGYICAGADAMGNDYNDLWQYDNVKDAWIKKADFPGGPRRELSCFVIDGYAYVGCGRDTKNDIYYNSFYKYDPVNDRWSFIANCPVARYAGVAFAIDSIGYFGCGLSQDGPRQNDLYAYNPRTNAWTQKGNIGTDGRVFPIAFSYNHKAYLFGGWTGNEILSDVLEYYPSTDAWSLKTSYPFGGRSYSQGFVMKDRLFIGMGRNSSDTDVLDWHYFNFKNNSWFRVTDHPTYNSVGGSSFVIGDKAYTTGGFSVVGPVFNKTNELSLQYTDIKSPLNSKPQSANTFIDQANGSLHVDLDAGQYRITLIDALGRTVQSFEGFNPDSQSAQFTLQEQASGIYTIIVESNHKLSYDKVYISN